MPRTPPPSNPVPPSDGTTVPTLCCGATLGDGTFTTSCTNVFARRFGRLDGQVTGGDAKPVGGDGWVTVKICNGKAAGTSSDGAELAATLR